MLINGQGMKWGRKMTYTCMEAPGIPVSRQMCGRVAVASHIILQVAASFASSCIRPVGHLCIGPMFYPKSVEKY